jgi:hypothetical protein
MTIVIVNALTGGESFRDRMAIVDMLVGGKSFRDRITIAIVNALAG